MSRIHIGNEWVDVPPGYIQAEYEYTSDLHSKWVAKNEHGETDEDLRQLILDKRVEFYHLFLRGDITITLPTPKQPWWKQIRRKISGQSTQTN